MGLYEKIFKRQPRAQPTNAYETLTAYQPHFSKWNGGIYENELVRAAIDTRARHISKLNVEFVGAGNPKLVNKLKYAPNAWQTWGQFLYRLSTILDNLNTAVIVPVIDDFGEITGYYPVLADDCAIVQANNEPYLRYRFATGDYASIELKLCGILTKFQYESDFFGSSNQALRPTMQLLDINNQAINEAVNSSGSFRFLAQMTNFVKPEDLEKERKRFTENNLKSGGGLLLFPNTYTNIAQINNKQYVADPEQIKIVQDRVCSYYGVSMEAIQNRLSGDSFAALYEGVCEWFAIQFSDVFTRLVFTEKERAYGCRVHASANRLQYMSNADKLQVSAQMADRGIMSINEIRAIWNLPPVEGGDERIKRGEYKPANESGVNTDA